MNEETIKVALAALLHDIGKFWQRAGKPGEHAEASAAFVDEFRHLFPYDWLDDIRDSVGNHHKPAKKDIEKIVKIADRLASAEREQGEPDIPRQDPDKTPLIPVLARVEFREEKPKNWMEYGYRLSPLQVEKASGVFPVEQVEVSSDDYARLWTEFEAELKRVGRVDNYFGLVTLLALLRKYTTFIPSATPWEKDEEHRTLPDISLYDHLKVASAIAVCLTRIYPDHLEALYLGQQFPVACLLRADVSGIQSFLYRIARAEPTAEFRDTAKRLRGRSFFLTLLADATADWLVRELGVSPANILFCGGGRFDLLVGVDETTKEKLDGLAQRLQVWLLNEFYGELGIQLACEELYPADFDNLERAFTALDDRLVQAKQRKFHKALLTRDFFLESKSLVHVCNYCQVTPAFTKDEVQQWPKGRCPQCSLEQKMGGKLPRTDYLAYIHGNSSSLPFPNGSVTLDLGEPLGVRLVLLNKDETDALVRVAANRNDPLVLYRINDTNFLVDDRPANVSCGFKFLGNAAPIAKERVAPNPVKRDKEPINPEEVLDFEEVAFMSSGARLLGVLKADVDYLGQVFGLGVTKSIARISTLSSFLDLFFSGWINSICEQLADKWHNTNSDNYNPFKNKIEGLFYIVYSGGDDMLILGPWDAVIDLAQEIYNQFRAFTCHNENITLSSGILLVKPHFPIQRFAQLVGTELDRAKAAGQHQDRPGFNRKDRISLLGETVRWHENEKGFDCLLDFGKKLVAQVGEDKLPRSFIYFLLRLHEQYFRKEGVQNLIWVPKFLYALTRRVRKEVITDPELNLRDSIVRLMQHIRIPASYVSLKMRRE
jgi:CRISPR-associated protein Csm1